MQIREIYYGEFPEICGLNPRFKPKSKKVKVVVDINVPQIQKGNLDLSSAFGRLVRLLPSLERHQCGEHLLEDLGSGSKDFLSQHSDQITDIAHMMEHVIIDLQANITGMDSCSGITCGYKDPSSRFDLFVECRNKRVGVFSALLSIDLLRALLTKKILSGRFRALISLAKYLYANKSLLRLAQLEPAVARISSEFGWKRRFVLSLLGKLRDFGFIDLKHSWVA
ncbi:MAG: hypothetical protein JSV10_10055 [Candidatus Zixiibacteriota bacterium]|nr:MAG: hypothetical protein JSV10_10055 [candidate division Zixibacteria bacterium]